MYVQDNRTDAEVFRQLQREAGIDPELDEMAALARKHLTARKGAPLTQIETDAPLTLTGQWGGD